MLGQPFTKVCISIKSNHSWNRNGINLVMNWTWVSAEVDQSELVCGFGATKCSCCCCSVVAKVIAARAVTNTRTLYISGWHPLLNTQGSLLLGGRACSQVTRQCWQWRAWHAAGKLLHSLYCRGSRWKLAVKQFGWCSSIWVLQELEQWV